MSNANQRSAPIPSGVSHPIVDVEPHPQSTGTPEVELSATTSLDDLLKAILGREATTQDDRGRLVEAVDAQVHGLRQELGIPEPRVDVLPPLPPSFSEFVRARHPESRGLGVWEPAAEWASRCARGLGRVLAATTWRRRPVLLVIVAGGAIVLGFLFGVGSRRSVSVPAERVLQAAPAAPNAQVSRDDTAVQATSATTLGDSSTPVHALATSGATVNDLVASEPALLSSVPPVYPKSVRPGTTLGSVELDLTIDVWGRVVGASVTSGPPSLGDAAVAAVLQWRYQPAMANGEPVASRQRVRMSFE